MKLTIGIDPDSKKHGVAFYSDGDLTDLRSMELMELYHWLKGCPVHPGNIQVHIEDVCAKNAAFRKSGVKNAKAGTAINRSVGKCQQAQIEIERMISSLGIEIVRHKISKKWKDKNGKIEFERVTGWAGRSNEDTRSAGWFGYLGCK